MEKPKLEGHHWCPEQWAQLSIGTGRRLLSAPEWYQLIQDMPDMYEKMNQTLYGEGNWDRFKELVFGTNIWYRTGDLAEIRHNSTPMNVATGPVVMPVYERQIVPGKGERSAEENRLEVVIQSFFATDDSLRKITAVLSSAFNPSYVCLSTKNRNDRMTTSGSAPYITFRLSIGKEGGRGCGISKMLLLSAEITHSVTSYGYTIPI